MSPPTESTEILLTPARRLPVWLPKALFESALIVLSVLLALGVDEWRDDRARQRRVAEALAGVRAELRENHKLVQEAGAYHSALADTFAALAARGIARPDPGVFRQGLLAPASVLRNAWESAEAAGTTNEMPYATVLQLSRVYARQAEYEAIAHALLETTYDQVARDGPDALLSRYAHYIALERDFAGRERQLAVLYDQVLRATR